MTPFAQKAFVAVSVVVVIAIAVRFTIIKNTNNRLRNISEVQTNLNKKIGTNSSANTNPTITNAASNANRGTDNSGPTAKQAFIYGVIAGKNASDSSVMNILKDLGVTWLRVNYNFSGVKNPDLAVLLENDFHLVVTFNYNTTSNIDTTYGTLTEWPAAGFPFSDETKFRRDIQDALQPVLPYLDKGQLVYAQIENETADASLVPTAKYWRGTVAQYKRQLTAFATAVHGLDKRFQVTVAGIPTTELDAVIQTSNAKHDEAVKHLTALFSPTTYDAVDLHFYGCVSDIAAKASWAKAHIRNGTRWISTENGGPDSRCASTPTAYDQNPSQYLQAEAQQVSQRLSACAQNGGAACLWFSLFDLTGEASVFAHMGLLTRDNPPQQKQAYGTFKSYVASHR